MIHPWPLGVNTFFKFFSCLLPFLFFIVSSIPRPAQLVNTFLDLFSIARIYRKKKIKQLFRFINWQMLLQGDRVVPGGQDPGRRRTGSPGTGPRRPLWLVPLSASSQNLFFISITPLFASSQNLFFIHKNRPSIGGLLYFYYILISLLCQHFYYF